MVTKILRCTFVLGFIFTQIACSSSKVAKSDDYSPETTANDGFADTDEVPMGFGDDQLPADLAADGGVTGTGEFPTDTAGTTEAPQSDMGDQPSYDIAGSTDTAMESQPTDAYGAYDEPAPITESSYAAESTPAYEAAPITDSTDYGTSEPSYSGASGSYRVKSGDTLMKIAFEQYGDLYRWKEILESNQGKIQDPNRLPAGLELSLADAGGVVIERNGENI